MTEEFRYHATWLRNASLAGISQPINKKVGSTLSENQYRWCCISCSLLELIRVLSLAYSVRHWI